MLKKYNLLCLICFATVLASSCSSDKRTKNSLPCIDVRKNYPEKEIILTDIADISYVHLNTENDDYLFKGRINYVTENTIVVVDESTGSILFFTKDGKPKSRFNRYGQGPQEYQKKILNIVYEETTDDVFVILPFAGFGDQYIQVYSSAGDYKRKLSLLPQEIGVNKIIPFDELSFLVFDARKLYTKTFMKRFPEEWKMESNVQTDSTFFLISKTDGRILDYVKMPFNDEVDLSISNLKGEGFQFPIFTRIVRCAEGAYLCNHETDTVFLYSNKDKSITPVMHKIPSVNNLETKIILDNCMETGRYQFLKIETLVYATEEKMNRYYMRDKTTGEFFCQKIILPDYKGKEFFITPIFLFMNGKETQIHFELDLFELKQAYTENRLSGNLKELVATLNEDFDNNVFMFVNFK